MEYKALKSFAGRICGHPGEIIVINDEHIAKDLLKAGYVEVAKTTNKTRSKGVVKDEN